MGPVEKTSEIGASSIWTDVLIGDGSRVISTPLWFTDGQNCMHQSLKTDTNIWRLWRIREKVVVVQMAGEDTQEH